MQQEMNVLPGLMLAVALAVVGNFLADRLARRSVSARAPSAASWWRSCSGSRSATCSGCRTRCKPGINFAVKRVLRLGIVLLGLRLSIVEVGAIGLKALPVILVTIPAAILIVELPRPAPRAARPARDADRGRHQHLRQHRHRRGVAHHRREGGGDQLRGRLHHGVRPVRDAGLPVRRPLDLRRRIRSRPALFLGSAVHDTVAGRRRGHGVPGVLSTTRRRSTSPRSPSWCATCRCWS